MAENLTAPAIAKELEVKPTALRAWLRAHGYQQQHGASYSFTRKEANAIKKAYAEATAPKQATTAGEKAPAKKGSRKAKAPEQPTPVEPEDIPDEEPSDGEDVEDLTDDDDVEDMEDA